MPRTGIHTVGGFLKAFKLGDSFWCHASHNEVGPTHVVGPCTIRRLYKDDEGERVDFVIGDSRGWRFISDAVNRWHGVYPTEEEAERALASRRKIWATRRTLVAECEKNRERNKRRATADLEGLYERTFR